MKDPPTCSCDDKPPRVRACAHEAGASRSDDDGVEGQKEPVYVNLYIIYNTHPLWCRTGGGDQDQVHAETVKQTATRQDKRKRSEPGQGQSSFRY